MRSLRFSTLADEEMAGRLNRLFVSNLPWTVGVKELREYFMQFGIVSTSHVLFDKDTGLSKGYGFIEFGTKDAQVAALNKENHIIDDQIVTVQLSGIGPGMHDSRNE